MPTTGCYRAAVRERPAPLFFLSLLIGVAALVTAVVHPLLRELLLAVVLASVLRPVETRLTKRLGGRRAVSAGIVTVLVVVLVLGPLGMLVAYIIREGRDGVQFVLNTLHSAQVADMAAWLPDSARDFVTDGLSRLPRTWAEVMGEVGERSESASAFVSAGVSATGSFLFHSVLMLIALFFTLAEGDRLVEWLDRVSPLEPGQTRELIETSKRVSFSIVVSTIVTAAVQALAALVGYLIAQVPSPIFFASVTFIVAFIPAVGAAVVVLAAAALLFLTGHPYMAMFLTAWGLIVVGLVDNVVKPLLIRRGMEVHGAIVFFALIGGLAAFGAIGLIVGPLVVSMFLSLLSIYHRDYSPQKRDIPPVPGVPARPSPEESPAEPPTGSGSQARPS